jgi:hypothetical protein
MSSRAIHIASRESEDVLTERAGGVFLDAFGTKNVQCHVSCSVDTWIC